MFHIIKQNLHSNTERFGIQALSDTEINEVLEMRGSAEIKPRHLSSTAHQDCLIIYLF